MEILRILWDRIPGSTFDNKLAVLGLVIAIPATVWWGYNTLRGRDVETSVSRMEQRLVDLEKKLFAKVDAKDRSQTATGITEVQKSSPGIKKDISEALKTLADAGKSEALEKLDAGDPKAADEALVAKIEEMLRARNTATKEEAALYRQRGALAYLNNPTAALPLYANAAALEPSSTESWNQLALLQMRTGEIDAAIRSLDRVLTLAKLLTDKIAEAVAIGNLGIIYQARGDLTQAEAKYRRALVIYEALNVNLGIASSLINLGEVQRARGDLAEAEVSFKRALELGKNLDDKSSIAIATGNLGIVYSANGNLEMAEAMYKQALLLNEISANKEGMAAQYGNIGNIHFKRGNLNEAELTYQKGLALDESLGNKKSMAKTKGNLGVLYEKRGDMIAACSHWRSARDLWQTIGNPGEIAKYEGWMSEAGCPEN